MSLFTLDTDRIVRMFNANGVKMSLSKAFRVAGYIENIHLERLNEVSNNSFDHGKKVGRMEAEADNQNAVELAYQRGKLSSANEHTNMIVEATLWAEIRFDEDNLKSKIRCIKKMRENFPTLGIRDGKYILDRCTGEGYGMTL